MKKTMEQKVSMKELLLYEMPTFAEFIPIGWLQDIIAMHLAWKVNRKYNRYVRRLKLAEKYGTGVSL